MKLHYNPDGPPTSPWQSRQPAIEGSKFSVCVSSCPVQLAVLVAIGPTANAAQRCDAAPSVFDCSFRVGLLCRRRLRRFSHRNSADYPWQHQVAPVVETKLRARRPPFAYPKLLAGVQHYLETQSVPPTPCVRLRSAEGANGTSLRHLCFLLSLRPSKLPCLEKLRGLGRDSGVDEPTAVTLRCGVLVETTKTGYEHAKPQDFNTNVLLYT